MLAAETPASLRRLGPARARRRGPPGRAPGRAPRAARAGARERPAAGPPHAGDAGPRARGRLVRPVRGRGPRRRRREAARGHVPAGQAGDAQDQARAHGRLRRRGLPLAQERPRDARREPAARAVRRRRATSTTSGSRRSFTWDKRAALVDGARAAPGGTRSTATRGASGPQWASAGSADASGQRLPGATSRWNRGKDLSWEPLRAERVVEVAYDHLQGDRFRHGTTFRRWRPDKPPADCRYDQLETTAPFELARIFGAG